MKLSTLREFPAELYMTRLRDHLTVASRLYPRAWRQFDAFRAQRTEIGDWPSWCFCPLSGAYSIVCDQLGVENLDGFARQMMHQDEAANQMSPTLDTSRLGGLAAWRAGQGVYVIDPTVLEAVLATPMTGAIPTEVLLGLPQWGIYVATPGFTIGTFPIAGFFAWLEHDANRGHAELRLMIDAHHVPPYYGLHIEVLHLYPGMSLEDSYERMMSQVERETRRFVTDDSIPFDAAVAKLRRLGGGRLAPMISVLLYLCSRTAEYRGAGGEPIGKPPQATPVKRKHEGWRIDPPDRPRIWLVGDTLGQAIRAAYDHERVQHGDRHGPSPHVRGAHWHGFWLGPRKGPRTFDLRWLPPIPVGLARTLDLVTTRPTSGNTERLLEMA